MEPRQRQPLPPHDGPRIEQALAEARRIRFSYAHDLLAWAWPEHLIDGDPWTYLEAARHLQSLHAVIRYGKDDVSRAAYELARPPFAASAVGTDCDGWNLAVMGSLAHLYHIGCTALFWPSTTAPRHATLGIWATTSLVHEVDFTVPATSWRRWHPSAIRSHSRPLFLPS